MTRSVFFAGLIAFVTSFASPTLANDVDPTVAFDGQIALLLGHERALLSEVSAAHFHGLTTPPLKAAAANASVEYTRSWVSSQPVRKGGDEWACLTQALYFEARGESVKGQFGVAEVILNRVASSRYPDSVCGVIHQGTGKKYQCQFTYTCDGRAEVISEQRAYDAVGKIAYAVLNGAPRNLTSGATHYHTNAVNPRWAKVFPHTATIGVHRFYRQPSRT